MNYRNPLDLTPRNVCPHCKQLVQEHQFFTHCLNPITTWHCPQCGDVIPMRSVVFNQIPIAPTTQTR